MSGEAKKALALALLLAAIGLALAFQVSHLKEPLTGDASYFISLQKEMSGKGDFPEIDLGRGLGLWHPMLYQYCLAAVGRLFGPELLYDRIFGMILFIVDCVLVLLIAAGVIGGPTRSLATAAAVSLFALSPLGIIGAVHIEIDNTVLTTLLLLYTWCFIRSEGTSPIKRLPVLSGVFAVLLLCKLTTPLAVIGAAFLTYTLQRRYRDALYYSFGVLIVGGLLFLAAWYLATRALDLPFDTVFVRLVSAATGKADTLFRPLDLMRLILTVLFCLTPSMIFLWLFVTIKTITDKDKGERSGVTFVALLSLIITVTYLFIGGLTYGVPKYHYPAIPLAAIVVAWGIKQYAAPPSRVGAVVLAGVSLLAAGIMILAGDPILHLNYDYKEYLLAHQVGPGISDGFFPFIFRDILVFIGPALFLLIGLVTGTKYRERIVWLLLVLAFSMSLSQYVVRFSESYNVIYAYGGRGGDEVLETIRPGSMVLIAEGYIIPAVSNKTISFAHPHMLKGFSSAEELVRIVDEIHPDYILTGITIDSQKTLHDIFESRVFLDSMETRYTRHRIGSYFLWEGVEK